MTSGNGIRPLNIYLLPIIPETLVWRKGARSRGAGSREQGAGRREQGEGSREQGAGRRGAGRNNNSI